MSSHHIVREKQEPALLFANGASCSDELMGQLLEWSPFILALDGAFERLAQRGIKVDAVLGDFDSITRLDDWLEMQEPIRVIEAPDQEKTDFEKGLDFLCAEGHSAVNVLWATGWRLDHSMANLYNLAKYRDKITINIIDDHSRVYLLPRSYEKWFPQGSYISLLPLNEAQGIHTQNLAWPLNGERLVAGGRIGTSNRVVFDGFVKITHESGDLLLMECFDESDNHF
jgi:thiamine pyrophosphokinase